MFKILFEKELKSILLSPKFVATFGVCSLLILLSVFVGIQEYKATTAQYETALQLTAQEISEETSWWGIDNRAYRKPDPMQVFVAGVNNDVGRLAEISTWSSDVKLEYSNYAEDTLFAVFRFIDFSFIVQVVLSLFAILFTYNAINGERESGTLKLALSNAVPRAQYVTAKFVGSWVGLTLPLLIPILLAVLIVQLLGIPMASVHWAKLGTLLGASILYFTFFILLGLLVSALTKRSAVSFLVLLVAWVTLVLIVPRAALMTAGQIVEVPSVAQVESQKDRFATDRREAYFNQRRQARDEQANQMAGMTPDERSAFRTANEQRWREEEDAMRQTMTEEIAEFSRKLNEEWRNQRAQQERLAFQLSRLSPATSYQLPVMKLTGTNASMKDRYEETMNAYALEFRAFVEEKRREERARNSGRRGGRRSVMNEESLDISELPRYQAPEQTYSEALAPTLTDFGLMSFFSIVAFAGAFVAFLRYDVR